MKNIKIFSFVLAFLLLTGMATGCKGGKGNPEERMNWMIGKVTNKLELDKDQESKLRDLVKTFHEERRLQKDKRKADREEFKAMILTEKLDKEKSRDLLSRHHTAIQSGFDPIFEKLQIFHASLTPGQKKKASKYLDKFEKRFH